jgi:hypothetical protein
LRREDNDLAVELCLSIVQIERSLGTSFDPDLIEREAENAARLLEEAGQTLRILE